MRPGLTIAILVYAAAVISVVFLWSLVHGASLWFFWLVYLGGGAANALLIYLYAPRLYARLRH